jgi:hypothetical protein
MLIAQSVVQNLSMQAVLKRLFVTVAQVYLELLVPQAQPEQPEQLVRLALAEVAVEVEHDLVSAHLVSVLAMTTEK